MESVNDRSKGTDNQLLKGKIHYAYELLYADLQQMFSKSADLIAIQ